MAIEELIVPSSGGSLHTRWKKLPVSFRGQEVKREGLYEFEKPLRQGLRLDFKKHANPFVKGILQAMISEFTFGEQWALMKLRRQIKAAGYNPRAYRRDIETQKYEQGRFVRTQAIAISESRITRNAKQAAAVAHALGLEPDQVGEIYKYNLQLRDMDQ